MQNKLEYKKIKSHIKFLPLLCISLLTVSLIPTESWALTEAKKVSTQTDKTQAKKKTKTKTKKKTKTKLKKAAKAKKPVKVFHVWGTGSIGKGNDNFILSKTKSNSYTGLVGMSYQVSQAFTLGFYYSNSYRTSRTPFTRLTSRGKSKGDANNYFLNASYNFSQEFMFNLVFGYSANGNRSYRFANRGPSPTINKTRSHIYSINPSLNYSKEINNIKSSFQIGYGRSESHRNASIDTNNRFHKKQSSHGNSAYVSGDLSYIFKDLNSTVKKLAPFVSAGLDHGFENRAMRQPNDLIIYRRQDGWKAGSGLRLFFVNDISFNAGWTISGGRSKQLNNSFSVTLRTGLF